MKNENKFVNIIYYDENLKFGGNGITKDCQKIEKETNNKIILVDNLLNFKLLLNYILKNNNNSKFLLIVNGSSAENIINFINKNNIQSLFINGCIYTKDNKKYLKIKEHNSNFIVKISTDCRGVINYINNSLLLEIKNNEKFYINDLIIYYYYKNEFKYFNLYKQLALLYGDESEQTFICNFNKIKEFISKDKIIDNKLKNELINCFKIFSLLKTKNYEKIISIFLKYENFSKYLNELLMKKELIIYEHIGYFAGNLIHSIVEYGKEKSKGIVSGNTFYKGMQLNIVEVLEFLKNKLQLVTFPYFLPLTNKKDFVELVTKRNITKKHNDLFSVIIKIEYLYDDGYEPVVFDLKDLAQYPDEEEYILLPFTFLLLKNIKIDSEKFIVDIDMEIIGRTEILEKEIKEGKTIQYDNNKHIMFIK